MSRLVVYVSPWCGNCVNTQAALHEWHVQFVKVDVKEDKAAAGRVRAWTGFESVPTLVIAGDDGFGAVRGAAAVAGAAAARVVSTAAAC